MRHHTTTALVLTALALTACSVDPSGTAPTASSSPRGGSGAADAKPLSSAALSKRLLTDKDLGGGYVHKAEGTQHNDDVTVIGCPALDKLGGEAATGQSLDFPNKAKVAFTYSGGTDSEVSEELYSDAANKLSDGVGRIFDAMASCPTYQIVSGSTAIDMTTQTSTAPKLGEEQWSQLLTYSAGGQRSVVKQTAIRSGSVLLIVSGSPGLVDTHLNEAFAKAQAAS